MTVFYAQPYTLDATGFYFKSTGEYKTKAARCFNDFGQQVEEFEIQFIDGESIDAKLFDLIGIHQGNIHDFMEKISEWSEEEKLNLIIAIGDCGYAFDVKKDDPSDFELEVYELDSLQELAEQFVEEGLYGDIPESLQFYIDYEAIARDLSVEYAEIRINGQKFIYRCS